jgi:hypothetical protein
MQYTTLGRTGLRVSVAGLGCGGSSRLGRAWGKSEGESVALVRRALPLPAKDVARLNALFGALEGIGLDLPRRP